MRIQVVESVAFQGKLQRFNTISMESWPCAGQRAPDLAHSLAAALVNSRIQASKDPQASQHQQNCGDRDTLVHKILCLLGAFSLAGGR
jgi:hypothetical protein